MKRRPPLALAGVAVAAGLTAAAPASGHSVIQGFTWYSDGSFVKSGPVGAVVIAYGTSAKPNTGYKLRIAPLRPEYACSDENVTDINPAVRSANGRGFIANTAGVVDRPPGEYEICFYEWPDPSDKTATYPAYLTVV